MILTSRAVSPFSICSFYTSVKPTAWVKLVQFLVLRCGPPFEYQVADKIYHPHNFTYRFVTVDLKTYRYFKACFAAQWNSLFSAVLQNSLVYRPDGYFVLRVTLGFCRSVNESFALLGCFAALIGSYRRFETTYRTHLLRSWTACRSTTGPLGCPETSVTNYQSTPLNIREERRSPLLSFLS